MEKQKMQQCRQMLKQGKSKFRKDFFLLKKNEI